MYEKKYYSSGFWGVGGGMGCEIDDFLLRLWNYLIFNIMSMYNFEF